MLDIVSARQRVHELELKREQRDQRQGRDRQILRQPVERAPAVVGLDLVAQIPCAGRVEAGVEGGPASCADGQGVAD